MLNITTETLREAGFRQRDNTYWWHYKEQTVFFVNLLSRTIRLNTSDRHLDFELAEDMGISEIVAMAESWNNINSLEKK